MSTGARAAVPTSLDPLHRLRGGEDGVETIPQHLPARWREFQLAPPHADVAAIYPPDICQNAIRQMPIDLCPEGVVAAAVTSKSANLDGAGGSISRTGGHPNAAGGDQVAQRHFGGLPTHPSQPISK